ncbi:MAG: hypothetical protein WCF65_00025 [Parachlamydiaceae bacterium]
MFYIAVMLCFSLASHVDIGALAVPAVEEGLPEAGKRVRVYLSRYPGAYYVLFLPYNFTGTSMLPLIFESPGNFFEESLCGLPEGACLGYGLTRGMDYIWVSVPFVDDNGLILEKYWGENPLSTVNFWLAVLADLNMKFRVDRGKVVLAGFSRGAVSTIYIGNYNSIISSKWSAYFAHAHFDGCCQTVLGNTNERIKRIKDNKVLITVGGDDPAKQCSKEAYEKLIEKGYSATYLEIPNLGHSPAWILEESEAADEARSWLKSLL